MKSLDEREKKTLNKVRLGYQTGKGNNHLGPILFPDDTFAGIEKLACPQMSIVMFDVLQELSLKQSLVL